MTVQQGIVCDIVGGLAGLPADALGKGIRTGLVSAVLVGILDVILGGWLFELLGISIGGELLGGILIASVGAVVLLVRLRALKCRKQERGAAIRAAAELPVVGRCSDRPRRRGRKS